MSWCDEQYSKNGYITGLEVRAGGAVDAIRVKYGTSWGPWHGGSGGDLYSFELNPGENIIKVQGTSGKLPWWNYGIIISIKFITNYGQTFGPYGGSTPGEISWESSAYFYYALIWIDGDDDDGPIKSLSFNYNCSIVGNLTETTTMTTTTTTTSSDGKLYNLTVFSIGYTNIIFLPPSIFH